MLKNYFKTAIRGFVRNRLFSLINIGGLAIGLAACFVIFQYVRYHLSFDNFHDEASQVFRVGQKTGFENGEVFSMATTYITVGPILNDELPEVSDQCRVYYLDRHAVVAHEEKVFEQPAVVYADPNFFSFFDHTFVSGTEAAFGKPNTVAISESVARRFFGEQDPIGKFLRLTEEFHNVNLMVTAVFADQPDNTHLKAELVASLSTIEFLPHNVENKWNWPFYLTYIKLSPQADKRIIEAKLPHIVAKYFQEDTKLTKSELFFQSLQEIHLYSHLQYEAVPNGNAYLVFLLLTIGVVTLAIAYANYINISSARAAERIKEIGIRKTLGSLKGNLIAQFMVEAGLFNTTALLLAAILVVLTSRYFVEITGVPITASTLGEPYFWVAVASCVLVGTLISSFYPVQIMSSIRTTNMLKGGSWLSGTATRQLLVVFQYTASASLLVVSFVIFQQMRFIKEQPLGIDISQILVVKGPRVTGDKSDHTHAPFKRSALASSQVRNVSLSNSVPGIWTGKIQGVHLAGSPEVNNSFGIIGIDADFMETYKLALIAGRPFADDIQNDSSTVIITQQAMKQLGISEPGDAIGQRLTLGSRTAEVIGVASDYHHFSLKQRFESFILYPETQQPEYFSISLASSEGDAQDAIVALEAAWKRHYPGNPFEYFFLDQSYHEQYASDVAFETVVGVFTALSILISSLGLFGLSAYNISRRKKEIGIRKVLGSSNSMILATVGGDFLKLVVLACVLAVPITYWGAGRWLENFEFRIHLSWWHFVLPVASVIAVAIATIGHQTMNAAAGNPVDAIKCE
jgi:putative ABC transport system permease protein